MTDWIVQDWFPVKHRIMDTAPEGSFKTTRGAWLCTCIASGTPFLGQAVKQGNVMIIDEETPGPTLYGWLNRFALSIGASSWQELPIYVESMRGFRFGRKTELDRIIEKAKKFQPTLIRLDSVIALLPGYRQGLVENDSSTGIALKDDLNELLSYTDAISISAHAKKEVAEFSLAQLKAKEMQSIVRGHGSIVGEACDTGLVIKKISEWPKRTLFVILTKARRGGIPMSSQEVYVETIEEEYGKGWAKLERVKPVIMPPTRIAAELFTLFQHNPEEEFTHEAIRKKAALYLPKELREAIRDLLLHKVILNSSKPMTYKYNSHSTEYPEYLAGLEEKDHE